MRGLFAAKKSTIERLTSKDVVTPKSKTIQELLNEISSRLKRHNHAQWLLDKFQQRPITTHVVVAFKTVWVIHKITLHLTIESHIIVSLRPILSRIIRTWNLSSLEAITPMFPGPSGDKDERHLYKVIADYGRYVDVRADSQIILETIIDRTWSILNGSQSSWSVGFTRKKLPFIIEQLLQVLSSLTKTILSLLEGKGSVFFSLYILGLLECLYEGSNLFKAITDIICYEIDETPILYVLNTKLISQFHSTILLFTTNYSNLLDSTQLLCQRYTEFTDVIPDACKTFSESSIQLRRVFIYEQKKILKQHTNGITTCLLPNEQNQYINNNQTIDIDKVISSDSFIKNINSPRLVPSEKSHTNQHYSLQHSKSITLSPPLTAIVPNNKFSQSIKTIDPEPDINTHHCQYKAIVLHENKTGPLASASTQIKHIDEPIVTHKKNDVITYDISLKPKQHKSIQDNSLNQPVCKKTSLNTIVTHQQPSVTLLRAKSPSLITPHADLQENDLIVSNDHHVIKTLTPDLKDSNDMLSPRVNLFLQHQEFEKKPQKTICHTLSTPIKHLSFINRQSESKETHTSSGPHTKEDTLQLNSSLSPHKNHALQFPTSIQTHHTPYEPPLQHTSLSDANLKNQFTNNQYSDTEIPLNTTTTQPQCYQAMFSKIHSPKYTIIPSSIRSLPRTHKRLDVLPIESGTDHPISIKQVPIMAHTQQKHDRIVQHYQQPLYLKQQQQHQHVYSANHRLLTQQQTPPYDNKQAIHPVRQSTHSNIDSQQYSIITDPPMFKTKYSSSYKIPQHHISTITKPQTIHLSENKYMHYPNDSLKLKRTSRYPDKKIKDHSYSCSVPPVIQESSTLPLQFVSEQFLRVYGGQPNQQGTPHTSGIKHTPKCDLSELEINADDIEIKELIGIGTNSQVFKAKWRGTYVAMKRLHATKKNQYLALKEFYRELGVMLRLRHPNLVLLMGASTKQHSLSLVTEYCAGGTLFHQLHSSPKSYQLSWLQKIKICIDIAKAGLFLHTATPAIIHRDLKSLNVLLAYPLKCEQDIPLAKVSDFGLSRIKHQSGHWAHLTGNAGTYYWMAPEVVLNREYTEKADIYSYGIVMYEILTQTIPYSEIISPSPINIALSVAHGKRPDLRKLPSNCPHLLRDIMVQCWQSTSTARPSFAHIVDVFSTLF